MGWSRWARWLEPIGQAIAFGAFSLQFFVVDIASTTITNGYLRYLTAVLDQHVFYDDPAYRAQAAPKGKIDQEAIENSIAQENALFGISDAEWIKARWRIASFTMFAVGAALTIVGKTASVAYSTKRGAAKLDAAITRGPAA